MVVFAAIYCYLISDHRGELLLGFIQPPNPNSPLVRFVTIITGLVGLPITLPVAMEKLLGPGFGVALAMVIVYQWALNRTAKKRWP
jgi:hypothetical protein